MSASTQRLRVRAHGRAADSLAQHPWREANDRLMRRVGGRWRAESFWLHDTGQTLKRPAPPQGRDLERSRHRIARAPMTAEPTPPKREMESH